MTTLRCLAVDDEQLALELLEDNIRKIPFLQLVKSCRNAMEAMEALQKNQVDLVFLDIQMPGLTGMQLAGNMRGKCMIIFLTAYENYALDGYNVNAVDYLLKPVAFERFMQAAMKAFELHTLKQPALPDAPVVLKPVTEDRPGQKFIYVYVEYNLVRVDIDDIRFIEGYKDYVKIHLLSTQRPVITRMSMKLLEEKLQPYNFLRVHKSYIVAADKITAIQKSMISIGTAEMPVSENYRDALMARIKEQNIL